MENLRSNSDILDLAIIGGGPAGTAAALEARRNGLSVAVWERDRFPRDKVCGEFISFEAHPYLQNEIPEAVALGPDIRSAEFVTDRGGSRTFRLPRPALGLSRRVLDAALWKAASTAGADVYEGEGVRRVEYLICGRRPAGTWEIESDRGTIRRSRSLIVACGRWWAIEGLSSPAGRRDPLARGDWIGAKAHFAGIPPRDRVEMYFFRGGYCGLAPVENGAFNVCCLVRREQSRQLRRNALDDFADWLVQVSHLVALEKRLQGTMQVSAVVTTAPVHLSRRRATQNGALMVGDASGFLDPFTGEGISMALHSGRLAAKAVARALSEGFDGHTAADIYGQSLSLAVRRSYMVAALARGIIQGPVWLHGLVTAPLPWVGKHLVRETRWRGNPRVEPGYRAIEETNRRTASRRKDPGSTLR